VIEFEQVTATGDPEQTRPILINTERISYFEPLSGTDNRCRIVLQDGRQVIAALPYRELRQLLVDSRSGLATALSS
jgi:hypothetical protein